MVGIRVFKLVHHGIVEVLKPVVGSMHVDPDNKYLQKLLWTKAQAGFSPCIFSESSRNLHSYAASLHVKSLPASVIGYWVRKCGLWAGQDNGYKCAKNIQLTVLRNHQLWKALGRQ